MSLGDTIPTQWSPPHGTAVSDTKFPLGQFIPAPAPTGVWIAWTWEGNGYLVQGIYGTAADAVAAFGSDGYTHIGYREFGEL